MEREGGDRGGGGETALPPFLTAASEDCSPHPSSHIRPLTSAPQWTNHREGAAETGLLQTDSFSSAVTSVSVTVKPTLHQRTRWTLRERESTWHSAVRRPDLLHDLSPVEEREEEDQEEVLEEEEEYVDDYTNDPRDWRISIVGKLKPRVRAGPSQDLPMEEGGPEESVEDHEDSDHGEPMAKKMKQSW
ncbi:hypothetical protein WMY93_022813 [Mugilogobius chulae]|uniref:Uncharacterized protein n=1 Tax=Mugilogobius chulae TaxID=88201 RepID=A0AAW0NF22_9GOBI